MGPDFFPWSPAEGDRLDVLIWPCGWCLTTQRRLCLRPAGPPTGSASDCSFLSAAPSCHRQTTLSDSNSGLNVGTHTTAALINAPQSSPQLCNYYLSSVLIVPAAAPAPNFRLPSSSGLVSFLTDGCLCFCCVAAGERGGDFSSIQREMVGHISQ